MGLKDVEAFKNELKNLWHYKKKISDLEAKIEELEYVMEGVTGIDYTRQHGAYNESLAGERTLALIEKYNRLLARKKVWEVKEKAICEVLQEMPDDERQMAIEIYADGRSMENIAEEKKINKSTLAYRLNSSMAKAIKKGGI